MIFATKTLITAIFLVIVLGAILLLPNPYRDLILVGVVGVGLLLALSRFETTWLYFLAGLPVLRLSGGLFNIDALTVSRVLLIVFVLVFISKPRNARALRALFRSNVFRFFGLFILANIVSAMYVSSVEALSRALTYLEPFLFFAFSYYLVSINRFNLQRILRAVVAGGIVVAAVGLYEIATQSSVAAILNPQLKNSLDVFLYGVESDRFGIGGRIGSLVGHPVYASIYFVLLLMVTLYYLRTYERSRWLQLVFLVTFVMLTLATGTRAGVLALGVALLILALLGPQQWSQRFLVLVALGGGVLLLVTLVPSLRTYLVASADIESGNAETRNIIGRIALSLELLRIFQQNLILGYGPGLIQKQALAGTLPTVEGVGSLSGIENQYATILADGGLVAGFFYLLFMLNVLWLAVRMLRLPQWRGVGLTLFALSVAYFVFATSATTLTLLPNLILMTLYGAFAGQFDRLTAKERVRIPVVQRHRLPDIGAGNPKSD